MFMNRDKLNFERSSVDEIIPPLRELGGSPYGLYCNDNITIRKAAVMLMSGNINKLHCCVYARCDKLFDTVGGDMFRWLPLTVPICDVTRLGLSIASDDFDVA